MQADPARLGPALFRVIASHEILEEDSLDAWGAFGTWPCRPGRWQVLAGAEKRWNESSGGLARIPSGLSLSQVLKGLVAGVSNICNYKQSVELRGFELHASGGAQTVVQLRRKPSRGSNSGAESRRTKCSIPDDANADFRS